MGELFQPFHILILFNSCLRNLPAEGTGLLDDLQKGRL